MIMLNVFVRQVEVISTKSTASMAFPLSLANFLVALQWYIYGAQLKDHFIQVVSFAIVILPFHITVLLTIGTKVQFYAKFYANCYFNIV